MSYLETMLGLMFFLFKLWNIVDFVKCKEEEDDFKLSKSGKAAELLLFSFSARILLKRFKATFLFLVLRKPE